MPFKFTTVDRDGDGVRGGGCMGTLRVCASREQVRLGWGVNHDAGSEAEAEVGVLKDAESGRCEYGLRVGSEMSHIGCR